MVGVIMSILPGIGDRLARAGSLYSKERGLPPCARFGLVPRGRLVTST